MSRRVECVRTGGEGGLDDERYAEVILPLGDGGHTLCRLDQWEDVTHLGDPDPDRQGYDVTVGPLDRPAEVRRVRLTRREWDALMAAAAFLRLNL